MNDIWNPWHGCHKYSEGCKYCYMYYLDNQRDKKGSDIYKVKTNKDVTFWIQTKRAGRVKENLPEDWKNGYIYKQDKLNLF